LDEIICGDCAQKGKLPLEERVTIALSVKKGKTYICKICLSTKHIPVKNNEDPEVSLVALERDSETKMPVKIFEQIVLFE
jgi:hypothetical protein